MEPVRFDSTLKTARLRTLLRNRLMSGEYQPGDRLPSEPDLILAYGVSRATVREAIASLEHEGLLNRIQGKGTYVADKRPAHLTIAVVMPYLFFSDSANLSAGAEVIPRLVQSIEAEARHMRASILLYLDNQSPRLERDNIEDLLSRKVDGVILNYIGGEENRDCLERIQAEGMPLVLIDRYVEGFSGDYVITDNAQGALEATQMLQAKGFARVLYLTPAINNTSLRDRLQGYEQGMKQSGQVPQVFYAGVGSSPASWDIAEALRTMEPPFALFAAEAPLLVNAYQVLQKRGLSPQDYALGCFDDPSLLLAPGSLIVRVEQPLREVGVQALRILREKLSGGQKAVQQVRLTPSLSMESRT